MANGVVDIGEVALKQYKKFLSSLNIEDIEEVMKSCASRKTR